MITFKISLLVKSPGAYDVLRGPRTDPTTVFSTSDREISITTARKSVLKLVNLPSLHKSIIEHLKRAKINLRKVAFLMVELGSGLLYIIQKFVKFRDFAELNLRKSSTNHSQTRQSY